jgi:uncharacterized caspase-like protein
MVKFSRNVAFLFALLFWGQFALAADKSISTKSVGGESRVALVIGNSAYPSGALANPKNDATAVGAALKNMGFDVELKLNASKSDIDSLLSRFSVKADKATVAMVFYAGHGIQVGGINYIVPIDAAPQSERDLKRQMVKMDDVIEDMGSAKVKLFFFDACRDNPITRSFSRGGTRGMAPPVEATGTLISFSTKHGNTALDGEGKNSPYTEALLTELKSSEGIEIEQMLRRVQQGVRKSTNGQQEPWRYGSLDGDFYFQAAKPIDNSKAQQEIVERAVQESVKRANEKAELEKAELQRAIKAEQDEALRRAKELAAKDREELQRSIKAQQEAADRALQDALRKANEQSAKEKTELQLAMDKILKEALAKQNAALEADRAAAQKTLAANSKPAQQETKPTVTQPALSTPAIAPIGQSLPSGPTNRIIGSSSDGPPTQVAMLATVNKQKTTQKNAQILLTDKLPSVGDEWSYMYDSVFKGKSTIQHRIKAVAPETGVLEELFINDVSIGQIVFEGKPVVFGSPNSTLMFAPYWSGKSSDSLDVTWGRCIQEFSCQVKTKMLGRENLEVKAGKFDTTKYEITIDASSMTTTNPFHRNASIELTVWYSNDFQRVIKQELYSSKGPFNDMKGSLELVSFKAPR